VSRRRLRLLLLLVPAVVVFLAVSALVARFLATEGRERDRIYALLRLEARGDERGVLAALDGCDAACARRTRAFLPRLAGNGEVKIARLDSQTSYTLGHAEGWTRVVWVRGVTSRPIVQCVRVRRERGPLTERSVSLLRVSPPLADNEDSC
jgi:hypothetical protein